MNRQGSCGSIQYKKHHKTQGLFKRMFSTGYEPDAACEERGAAVSENHVVISQGVGYPGRIISCRLKNMNE